MVLKQTNYVKPEMKIKSYKNYSCAVLQIQYLVWLEIVNLYLRFIRFGLWVKLIYLFWLEAKTGCSCLLPLTGYKMKWFWTDILVTWLWVYAWWLGVYATMIRSLCSKIRSLWSWLRVYATWVICIGSFDPKNNKIKT